MEDNMLFAVIAFLVALVLISAMLFYRLRTFNVCDIDAGASFGEMKFWLRGRDSKP